MYSLPLVVGFFFFIFFLYFFFFKEMDFDLVELKAKGLLGGFIL